MTATGVPPVRDDLVTALRAAGCVFAEDEADVLLAMQAPPAELAAMAARRCGGEPLEHVVGHVTFGALTLRVGPGMFVPRQRSLLLAAAVVDACRRRPEATMLELCCGVAPLAATVERAGVAALVAACDSDPDCCAVARHNLQTPHVYEGDLFAALPRGPVPAYDVIAVVPPYVPRGQAELLPREARDYEPAAALYGGSDGLDVVRRIISDAPSWLSRRGVLLMELHASQAPNAAEHAARFGLLTRCETDGETNTSVLSVAPGVDR